MITAAFPCQSQHYTLFCGLGSGVGVEIAEETSRRGELSCAGMTLAVFQHDRVEKFKKVYFKKTPKGAPFASLNTDRPPGSGAHAPVQPWSARP